MKNGEFRLSRLVAVYDAECPWSREDDFFLAQANLIQVNPAQKNQTRVEGQHIGRATRVLDLGCGTGRLALGLSHAGHHVTGVDPAAASLTAARAKPGADRVTWLEGYSDVLPDESFDVVLMTSHVAQFLVDEADWARTLADVRRALAPSGALIFDSRDPADRRWLAWNPVDSRHSLVLPDGSEVDTWVEVTSVVDGVVTFTHHYVFADEELLSTSSLRFRPEADLRSSLTVAGFTVERFYGGWGGEPVGQGDGEFIVVARAGH